MKMFSFILLFPTICLGSLKITDGFVSPVKFKNYPLEKFVEDYAVGFNKTVLTSSLGRKNGAVNFNLNKKVSLDTYEKMFLTVLESHGFAVVEDRSFTRIIETRDIRYTPNEFYTSNSFPKDNRYILVFHELKNPLAHDITRNMRPFMSRYGRIINFKDGHSIVINDRGAQVEKLLGIINSLDKKEAMKNLVQSGERKKKKNKYDRLENNELEEEKLRIEKEIIERKIKHMNSSVREM